MLGPQMKSSVIVLGSGPIRIGQGIEFDYSCVHCVWALEEMGRKAIVINNNPETVSTDFDTSDGLFFEPVTLEDVLDVIRRVEPEGVVVQFGGQTAINLAEPLAAAGIKILGTSPESIALAEDRDAFERLLDRLGIPKPPGRAVRSLSEAVDVAEEIGYPVLVRPSFVLGGRAMEIVEEPSQLLNFYREAEEANPGQPVLIDKYFLGAEAEVDVISDGEVTLVPGIMEHIERAGIHSGDSMAVFPPVTLGPKVEARIVEIAQLVARDLKVKGMMNIQFVVQGEEVYVLEVNPRASRTVPYLSKVTGVPMVRLATRCALGESMKEMGWESGLWVREAGGPPADSPAWGPQAKGRIISPEDHAAGMAPEPPLYAVKAPVFSFQKLAMVEPSLGPEMKSTGEVLGLDADVNLAIYKALVASGIDFKPRGQVILTVADPDKPVAVQIGRQLSDAGYRIAATGGTHEALTAAGVPCDRLAKLNQGSPTILDRLFKGEVSLMINTPGPGSRSGDGARIRRACIEMGVACVTSIETAQALANALRAYDDPSLASCRTLAEHLIGPG